MHSNCLEFHWNMMHMVAWILDISTNIHQVHHTYWWEFRHIHIMRMVLKGIRALLFFNTVWLCPDVYSFSLHLFLVHSLHRISTFSHGFSGIWNVYSWCIQHVYIGFHFSRLVIRPLYIYAFSNITSPIVPVACGCLLVGSTPPWGPGPQ